MSRVPPELIGLDNVMEDFLAEHRRKNLRVVEAETAELIKSSEEIWEHYMHEMRRQKQLWADAHMRIHFPESESEADRKFIESVEKIRAANRALPKVKRRGLLIGLLAGAILWGALGLIVWMVR